MYANFVVSIFSGFIIGFMVDQIGKIIVSSIFFQRHFIIKSTDNIPCFNCNDVF